MLVVLDNHKVSFKQALEKHFFFFTLYYIKLVFMLRIIDLLFDIFFFFSSSSNFYKNENVVLFKNNTPLSFVDIKDGSMDRLNEWLIAHPITLVMFYAPWSGQSIKAVPEILTAHSSLENVQQVLY